jgi:hypothetical protein
MTARLTVSAMSSSRLKGPRDALTISARCPAPCLSGRDLDAAGGELVEGRLTSSSSWLEPCPGS